MVLVQVVAAILLVLGSLLVLHAVSLADAHSPQTPRRGPGPVLVPQPAPVPELEVDRDWRRAA